MSGVVVDTSAAMAILVGESGGEDLLAALGASEPRVVSAGTVVELGIVLESRLGPAGGAIADRFLRDGGIEVVDVDRTQVDRALEGWRRFGKGRHPAGLNFGDCFAYGLAAVTGWPVLCIGDDFARTDAEVLPARSSPAD